ncbi:hypothetical protein DMH15_02915 [Streptomyces sp. WAC 06725]|uniref:hypothetical protein n=1 Tax=Streptomyces sp. WAC 06725 TaxID=2203209 RepID=UPI000F739B00|nr:hypothetical protein [Streptomyces sp. WAC 06725]RSO49636.1 hypothetical protein DMH15_02915 [Streptomyces sp. WAC 06725]
MTPRRHRVPTGGNHPCTSPTTSPAPFNADDLKPEHAEELGAFLNGIVRHLSGKHPEGSVEERAARTLKEVVGVHLDGLNEYFEDEEPETLRARKAAWNRLMFIVRPWEGLPQFDGYRWRLVLHTDADEAVETARRLLASREKAAQEKRRVLEGR